MQHSHALFAKRERSSNDTNQRPPKPDLVWNPCSWCEDGRVDGRQCSMCKGDGGWGVIAADPNKETAGAWWLSALAVVCVLVVKVVAG